MKPRPNLFPLNAQRMLEKSNEKINEENIQQENKSLFMQSVIKQRTRNRQRLNIYVHARLRDIRSTC